jgi:predicted AlkP superfamily pyrophosphatase or phosphodiesterase
MKKILLPVVALAAILLMSQAPAKDKSVKPNQPKLVVGIVVDQMRFDYIYRFWNKYSANGIKRLVNEGYFCRNTNFNYMPTYTGPGHASIFTGTTPAVHGIISNNWYDRSAGKEVYCAQDPTVNGVGSTAEEGRRSPARMLTSTVCDQLRLSSIKKSRTFGIALKDRGAILPAGHTANGAYWYDGASGNWITSSYYMNQLPAWVNTFNAKKLPQAYLAQTWNTLLPIEQYTESLPDDNPYEGLFKGETKPVFPHDLAKLHDANGKLGMVRSTPWGNTLTSEFAKALIEGEQLGKTAFTDMLTLSFSSPDYVGHMYGPQSIEAEDTYLRFDQDLANFLTFLDTYLGKNNVLVFLTADHGAVEVPQYLKDNKIPAGYFDERILADSLKKVLKRTYGDSLLLSYSNDQIFLDRKAIAAKNLNKSAIEQFVADYCMKFEGVAATMTATDLNANQYDMRPKREVQNGYNFQRSGDVCVILKPSWFGEWDRKTGTTHGAPWSYDTHVPLIWYGWKVQHGSTDVNVNIPDIAPTLSLMLNIQYPSGCTGQPILGITK